MLSPQKTRAPKRRIDEIDDRIECLTEVINTIKGHERPYFDLKLIGVQLKKKKLISLTSFAQTQKMQTILAEMEFLVAENDLSVEIEAIKNSKKFKKSEISLRRREKKIGEDLDSTEIIETVSSHSTPKTKRKKIDRASLSLTKSFPNIPDPEEDKENNPLVNNKPRNMSYERMGKATLNNANDAITKQKLRISRALFGSNEKRINNDKNGKDLVKEKHDKRTDNATLNEQYISSSHLQNHKIEPPAITQKESKKAQDKKHTKPNRKSKDSTTDPINIEVSKRPASRRREPEVINTTKSNASKETNKVETGKDFNVETTPEATGTHKNVINLYRTYKKIYSPEVSTANKIKLSHPEKACSSVSNKESAVTNDPGSKEILERVIKISNSMANITDRSKKKHQNDESSKTMGKKSEISDKTCTSKNNSKVSRNTKSEDLVKKVRRTYTKRKGLIVPKTTIPVNSKENIKEVKDNEKVITYMTELVNKSNEGTKQTEQSAMSVASEKTEVNLNDTMNSIIFDLLSKQVKIEEDPSDKMSSCFQCGSVYEGHMCAYTIRELLEQC